MRKSTRAKRFSLVAISAIVVGVIATSGLAATASLYGEGSQVACYIEDRSKPSAMPGWTMLWKDSVARSKGCENVLAGCHDMKQRWGGTDVCCTLQNADKKVYGKQAGSDACIDEACTPEPGWSKCARIGSTGLTIHATSAVSESAVQLVSHVIATMLSHLDASNYPPLTMKGVKVYITNGEDAASLSRLYPVGSMSNYDELRGGANGDLAWVTEQMICKTGVATRNAAYAAGTRKQRDDAQRTVDQVIHEFAHTIDFRYDLRPEIMQAWRGANQPWEYWAESVRWYFQEQPGLVTAPGLALVKKVFPTPATFSCANYNP